MLVVVLKDQLGKDLWIELSNLKITVGPLQNSCAEAVKEIQH